MRQLKICDKNYGDGTYGKIKERERERERERKFYPKW